MTGSSRWYRQGRFLGLRILASALTVLTVLGHLWLGFEQAWLHPLVALAATYGTDLGLEFVDARANRRRATFEGGLGKLVDFLLPAHISGLAIALLLYPGERVAPIVFACVVAMASKTLVRVRSGTGSRHFLNPSNFGLAVTFLAFPSVGLAPPYMFTEELGPVGDWVFPAIMVVAGTALNARFTKRLPLLGTWILVFVAQAGLRSILLGSSFVGALGPMTGLGFLLFTFYMITDPATTPGRPRQQAVFGASVACGYGLLMATHVVFGMFFALAVVCTLRGLLMAYDGRRATRVATA